MDGEVQRGQFGSILDSGIHISLDTYQEQDTFNVRVLNCHMEKIPTLVVYLRQEVETTHYY